MHDPSFYFAAIISLAINTIYVAVALLLGICAFRFLDKRLFPDIDFIEEIKRGNIAAAIFASTLLVFIAVIIGFAIRS